jgi:hypothetical protein
MGNSVWYNGEPHPVMGIDPYDEDYFKFNLADLEPEEQEEHKFWDLLHTEHTGMSEQSYPVSRTLKNMRLQMGTLPLTAKRNLILFEVKLLTFMSLMEEGDAVNILKMAKSSDEDNIYLAHIALKEFTKKRIHRFGNASVNEQHRSKIYNDSANVCYEHLSEMINLTK